MEVEGQEQPWVSRRWHEKTTGGCERWMDLWESAGEMRGRTGRGRGFVFGGCGDVRGWKGGGRRRWKREGGGDTDGRTDAVEMKGKTREQGEYKWALCDEKKNTGVAKIKRLKNLGFVTGFANRHFGSTCLEDLPPPLNVVPHCALCVHGTSVLYCTVRRA